MFSCDTATITKKMRGKTLSLRKVASELQSQSPRWIYGSGGVHCGFLPVAWKRANNLPCSWLNSTSVMQERSCGAAKHFSAGLQAARGGVQWKENTIFLAEVWANPPSSDNL